MIGETNEERTAYEVSVQEVYEYVPKLEKHLIFDEDKALKMNEGDVGIIR